MAAPWTDDEIKLLRAEYRAAKGGPAPLKAIAEKLGRTPGVVAAKARALGLGARPEGYRFGRPTALTGTLGGLATALGGAGKLAAKLGVGRRIVQRWAAGESPSLAMKIVVAALAAEHGVELDATWRLDAKTAKALAKIT